MTADERGALGRREQCGWGTRPLRCRNDQEMMNIAGSEIVQVDSERSGAVGCAQPMEHPRGGCGDGRKPAEREQKS